MNNSNFHEQQDRYNTTKLRNILQDLPEFTYEFFRGVEHKTSSRTRIAYAYDLRIFFDFLFSEIRSFKTFGKDSITLRDLENVTPDHIEIYMEYLSYYNKDSGGSDAERTNHERGKSRN